MDDRVCLLLDWDLAFTPGVDVVADLVTGGGFGVEWSGVKPDASQITRKIAKPCALHCLCRSGAGRCPVCEIAENDERVDNGHAVAFRAGT